MKNQWLLLGLACILVTWTREKALTVICLFFLCIYHKRHYKVCILFYVVLFVYLLRIYYPISQEMPKTTVFQVREIKSNYIIAAAGKQKIVVYQAGSVNFGDVIEVEGKLSKVDGIRNFRMFSFPDWLKKRNIYYQMNAKSVQLRKEGVGIRHAIYKHIQNLKDQGTRSWINSMVYGIHEDDVSFFITSSGMHIAFLFHVLESLLALGFSQSSRRLISILGMGLLGYGTIMSTSLIRILCFRSVTYVGDKQSAQDKLGQSIVMTLLLFPYMAFELAFILPVSFRLVQLFCIQQRNRSFQNMLVLLPIQFLFFHVCNPLQILFFRFLRTFYALLYAFALLSIVFNSSLLYGIYDKVIPMLQGIESIGFSMYYTPHLLWLLWWIQSVMSILTLHRKKDIVNLLLLIGYVFVAPYLNPFGEVLMLDVGQGDCTIVILPFRQGVMLIDVMGSKYKNIPADIIVPILQSKGIHSIDKIILTHDDMDHSGGIDQLKEHLPVKEIITKKQLDTELGTLHIPFLLTDYQGKDINDNSIVTYLEVYGTKFLFMGDAGIEAEHKILDRYPNLKIDVLKAGHHGSKTSSSPQFLHAIDAKLALISCGRNNLYGHPSKDVITNMKKENMIPLVTAQKGAVSIIFSKYFSFYKTADREFGILYHR